MLRKKTFSSKNIHSLLPILEYSDIEVKIFELKQIIDGSFAILLVGEPGTGKTFALKKAYENKGAPHVVKPFQENIKSQFEAYFKKVEKEESATKPPFILIEHLELFNTREQVELFESLSVNAENECVEFEKKKLPQIIADTGVNIADWRQRTDVFRPLIERFAQQTFYFGPVRELNADDRLKAFRSVWDELRFVKDVRVDEKDREPVEFPEAFKGDIKSWLHELNLIGNFRDLQAIAIWLWRGLTQPELCEKSGVKNAFDFAKQKFEANHVKTINNPFFKKGIKANELLKEFKFELASWAKEVYPDTKTILENLEIAEKTFYNWENKK